NAVLETASGAALTVRTPLCINVPRTGLNVTANVHEPPTPRIAGELPGTQVLFVTANGYRTGIVMALIVSGAWLVLLSVTVWLALAMPTTELKDNDVAETL